MARDPIGDAVRNLFRLQRLSNGLAVEARQVILALFDDIVAQLARIDPSAPRAERWRRERVQKLLGVVAGLSRERFDELHRLIRDDLAAIGTHQSGVAVSMLRASLGGVIADIAPGRIGVNLVKSILDTDPIQGELLRDWFRGQAVRTSALVRRQLQLGMVQNETVDDMVRRIRGRAVGPGRYVGGVMQTTTREATAIVRTAVTHVANVAHLRTYRENDDIVAEVEFVATLDERTTLICGSLDGQRWPVDSSEIKRPPRHVNCRSALVPVIDWAGLGLEAPEDGARASSTGPVSAATTYENWLRDQPRAVQNEILGPTRAELFRSGRMNLRDLVNSDAGVIPVAQLQQPAGGAPGPGSLPPAGAAPGAKSTQPPGPARLAENVGAFEDDVRLESIEHAMLWDTDGTPIFRKTDNAPDYVTFSPVQLTQMQGRVLSHNHPGSASFSPADVMLASTHGLVEIRVASRHFDYTIAPGPAGWPAASLIDAVTDHLDQQIYAMLYAQVVSGSLTAAEAHLLHWHLIWEMLSQQWGMRYTRTPKP